LRVESSLLKNPIPPNLPKRTTAALSLPVYRCTDATATNLRLDCHEAQGLRLHFSVLHRQRLGELRPRRQYRRRQLRVQYLRLQRCRRAQFRLRCDRECWVHQACRGVHLVVCQELRGGRQCGRQRRVHLPRWVTSALWPTDRCQSPHGGSWSHVPLGLNAQAKAE